MDATASGTTFGRRSRSFCPFHSHSLESVAAAAALTVSSPQFADVPRLANEIRLIQSSLRQSRT